MALDMRARPSNRTKTAEEIAQEEKERLEELEVMFYYWAYYFIFFFNLFIQILIGHKKLIWLKKYDTVYQIWSRIFFSFVYFFLAIFWTPSCVKDWSYLWNS